MPTYLSPGVYVEEVSSGSKPLEGVGTAVAAFVGFAEQGPVNEPVLVTNWTQFTRTFGGFVAGTYLAHSVYGYFLNGGGSAYVVRLGAGSDDGRSNGRGNGSGPQAAIAASAELPATGLDGKAPEGTPLALHAKDSGPTGNAVTVEVREPSEPGDDKFTLVVRRDGTEEVYENVAAKRGAGGVKAALARSELVTVEEARSGPIAVPTVGSRITLSGGFSPVPERVGADEYVGDAGERTGLSALETIEDVTMLIVPDLMSAHQSGMLDDEGLRAVQLAMIAHCELMGDRVAVLDAPPDLKPQQLFDWRVDVAGYDSKYATLYWPWLRVADPVSGTMIDVPPSGHVAGVWARNDDERGVHKAPANEVVRGVVDLPCRMTRGEHDRLNPVGINCIRSMPGQGIRVWGARTLSSDPEWRYLNVRRLFNYVEKSILDGTNWVVFEPNDRFLWTTVERTISMFLRRVWRSGALFGDSPDQAFYVKCDAENNPEENRDAGILTVDVGIAPVKPAEFVVFRLSQFSEGAALNE